MNKRDEMLQALQAWSFAAFDMFLFMDTHPDCAEAQRLFREFYAQASQMRQEYVKQYGPLRHGDVATSGGSWVYSPWPWEAS